MNATINDTLKTFRNKCMNATLNDILKTFRNQCILYYLRHQHLLDTTTFFKTTIIRVLYINLLPLFHDICDVLFHQYSYECTMYNEVVSFKMSNQ